MQPLGVELSGTITKLEAQASLVCGDGATATLSCECICPCAKIVVALGSLPAMGSFLKYLL